jgi:hypothetical protein
VRWQAARAEEAVAPVGDVHRPRRIDDDTIAYVRHLELPLQTMDAQDDLEVGACVAEGGRGVFCRCPMLPPPVLLSLRLRQSVLC